MYSSIRNVLAARIAARLARNKKEAWLEKYGVDLKCGHCGAWSSETEEPFRIESFGHPIAVRHTCGMCDKDGYWVCEAGFWFPAADFGIFLTDEDQPHG